MSTFHEPQMALINWWDSNTCTADGCVDSANQSSHIWHQCCLIWPPSHCYHCWAQSSFLSFISILLRIKKKDALWLKSLYCKCHIIITTKKFYWTWENKQGLYLSLEQVFCLKWEDFLFDFTDFFSPFQSFQFIQFTPVLKLNQTLGNILGIGGTKTITRKI